MPILTVGHTKGGVGKTTVATNLAVIAASEKQKVLLIDSDPQGSAISWRQLREKDDINVIRIDKPSIHKDIAQIKAAYDVVIIDVGGRDGAVFRSAMLACNVLLVPTLHGAYDIWAARDVATILQDARVYKDIAAYFVLNRVQHNVKAVDMANETLQEFENEYDIKLLNSVLYNRTAYNCADTGKGVIEMPHTDKASGELIALWKELNLFNGVRHE